MLHKFEEERKITFPFGFQVNPIFSSFKQVKLGKTLIHFQYLYTIFFVAASFFAAKMCQKKKTRKNESFKENNRKKIEEVGTIKKDIS